MKLECVICFEEATYVWGGFSLCRPHYDEIWIDYGVQEYELLIKTVRDLKVKWSMKSRVS